MLNPTQSLSLWREAAAWAPTPQPFTTTVISMGGKFDVALMRREHPEKSRSISSGAYRARTRFLEQTGP
jgi:hypothetical protein